MKKGVKINKMEKLLYQILGELKQLNQRVGNIEGNLQIETGLIPRKQKLVKFKMM